MKILIKSVLIFIAKTLAQFFFLAEKKIGYIFPVNMKFIFRDHLIKKIDSDIYVVKHKKNSNEIKFKLHTPNKICLIRSVTFSDKEPETLNWIDEFGDDGVLFDIGANIGIYSIYFALSKNGNVFSFEPSVFNLRQLAKNISINNLENRISIIPNPLSNNTTIANFINGSDDEGEALSAFGVDYGFDNKAIQSNIKYGLLGFTLDELFQKEILKEFPTLIKIDVDGIEHKILQGAKQTLKNPLCKSVLVEVNDNFDEQADGVLEIMLECGFRLVSKSHSELFAKKSFANTYNQIWVKN